MKTPFIIILMTIAISGCATHDTDNAVNLYLAAPTDVKQATKRKTVTTGDLLVTSWSSQAREFIHINVPVIVNISSSKKALGTVKVGPQNKKSVVIPKGAAVHKWNDAKGFRYYESLESVKKFDEKGIARHIRGGIRIANGNLHDPAPFWLFNYQAAFWVDVEQEISYKKTEPEIVSSGELRFEDFGQTITYLGLSKGQLHFVYKEFNDELIRSAFTQEFSFDYKPEQEYSYKNAKFIVHSATASEIDITALKYFTD